MCNRYRMTAAKAALAARFGIEAEPGFDKLPPPELFPKKPAWVVRQDADRRVLDVMSWGFPHKVLGASGKMLDKPVTNVRNLTSSFWRSALANPARRCLVPVTEFSEYGSVRGPDGKLPLYWFSVPSRPIFAFAGVWRPTEAGPAFAFLTCEPNEIVRPIHPKAMPVILHDEDFDAWLRADYDEVCAMAAAYPSQLMTQFPHAE